MIAPLSARPYHTLRAACESLSDKITGIFFRVLSLCNIQFQKYCEYYERKADWRNFSLNAGKHLINSSVNGVHPKKVRELPAYTNPEFILKENTNDPEGFCLGMCYDYVRRLNALNLPFSEKISLLAKKFENGATKKAYIIQSLFKRLTPKESAFEYKHKSAYAIREWVINSLNFGLKIQYIRNNLSIDQLSDGDYFIFQGMKDKMGHVVCLSKREKVLILFDPSIGFFLFRNPNEFCTFITNIAEQVYNSREVEYSLYRVTSPP